MSQRLERYQVGERIGKGAMGEVFHAYDTQTERDVAIKMIPARLLQGQRLKRFKLEARTIARIEHPFVVPLYDYSVPDSDEQPYLVMRYMKGGTLADKISQGGLHSDEVAQITRRIAAALDVAHERNLVHRDLKPSNILLDQNGYSYLADFGIVKDMGVDDDLTDGGQPGTAHYMSPEQITGKMIDGRSDIYALGILVFEMLTGVKPFQGNLNTIFQAHIYEDLPKLYNYLQNVPDEVDDVLRRATAKNPDDRYRKASQMAQELEAALKSPLAYMRARSALERDELAAPEFAPNPPPLATDAPPKAPAPTVSPPAEDPITYLNYPLDYLPEPQPLPPHSRMSYRQNHAFVNRHDELQKMAHALKNGQAVVISGSGGVGKTQLSVEFVHRYGHYFVGGVFWLNFADAENVPSEVAACGGAEALSLTPKFDKLDQDDQIRLVQQVWQQPMPRLLIFDNCEDKALLEKWWPKTGGCRVIVTSRQTRWSRARRIANLTLEALPAAESVQLIQKYVPDLAADEATAIAAELGNLPLALHLAGSFLERYQGVVTPAKYFAQLREHGLKHPSLTGRGVQYSPTDHELNIARTIALSYEQLHTANEVDEIALALLARAAHFAPNEPIPRDLLFETINLTVDDLDAILLAEDGMVRLQDLGLAAQTEQEAIWLHRLVAKYVQQAEPEATAVSDVETTLWQRAKTLNDLIRPLAINEWQTHLRYVTNQALAHKSERTADLCHEFGIYLRLTSRYEEAYTWLERAWELRKQLLGSEHLETARSLNDLGVVLAESRQMDEALVRLNEALAIREKLAPIHVDTAESYVNLCNALEYLNQLEDAREYGEKALAIYEALPETLPWQKAQALNNLGVTHIKLGNMDSAHSFLALAWDSMNQSLDSEHTLLAHVANNLGTLNWSLGDKEQAKQYFDKGMFFFHRFLGEWHPLTATAYNNLGVVLREIGDFEAAQIHMDKAIGIFQEMEPGSTNLANALRNLGLLYQKRQELEPAREIFEQALETMETWQGSHGPHPMADLIANHLASLETTDA
ncbi:MAG: tetratricopeptide repeat protein [Chloroflexota bacterium]